MSDLFCPCENEICPGEQCRECGLCSDCVERDKQFAIQLASLQPEIMETIEHAAVKVNNYIHKENIEVIIHVPNPGRHHHIFWGLDNHLHKNNSIDRLQGFITSTGRFVDRKEGEVIARASGQLTEPNIGGPMTSEDLW